MKSTYRISEQDYVSAAMLAQKRSSRIMRYYYFAAIALVILAIYGSYIMRIGAIGALVGGFVGSLIERYVLTPILARRHYRRYKAIQQEFTVELADDGVQFSSSTGSGKIAWEQVHKWKQDERFVLIYLMPRLFHIIKKSLAEQGFDLQLLTDKLLHHVGKPA